MAVCLYKDSTGFCRIFATGMFQTSSKCYDRAVLLWSRSIVLATTLPNKEGSWVLGLQGSVAKILQNPVCRSIATQQPRDRTMGLCKLWLEFITKVTATQAPFTSM